MRGWRWGNLGQTAGSEVSWMEAQKPPQPRAKSYSSFAFSSTLGPAPKLGKALAAPSRLPPPPPPLLNTHFISQHLHYLN